MTGQLYVTARVDTSRSAASGVSLTPEYFRKSAQAYLSTEGDRIKFLQRQLVDLEASLLQYARAMQELINKGAKLNGQSTAATWLTAIGSGVSVIPIPYTMIAGAVITMAGAIVGFSKRNKDAKEIQELAGEANLIQQDITQIQAYYSKYKTELMLRQIVLPVAAFYFIYNYA